MNLVIVESPAKAKTIEKYLGRDYKVLASFGHVRDLPSKSLGIKTEENYLPNYQVLPKAKKVLAGLKSAADKAKIVYLATDLDREGEAISWHLVQALKLKGGEKTKRIVFHEITKRALDEAVAHPRDLDINLVDAQQARRILDRLVGYKLSPLLWKKVKTGLSAGRVQSVAVRLVVEKEREIRNFKAIEYWVLGANLAKQKIADTFQAFLSQIGEKSIKKYDIKSALEADKIATDLENSVYTVLSVLEKESIRKAPSPFTTSTLQMEASRKLGFSPKQTMVLAQHLYEEGHITYMRTDSTNLSDEAVAAIRKSIQSNFGAPYLPASAIKYQTKTARAQEAHEAIRPANFNNVQVTNDARGQRLYELIWKRTIASQMTNAIFTVVNAKIEAKKSESYIFTASGERVKFDGFLRIYSEGVDEESDEMIGDIPKLSVGEILDFKSLIKEQKFTQPPARYSEAMLVKKMESLGIGRPSTYAPTLETIQQRGYVVLENKRFAPTEIAEIVTDLLMKHFQNIVDYQFTAKMEDELDEIAVGEKKWTKVIDEFYKPFEENLALKSKEINKEDIIKPEILEEKCPECQKNLMIKLGRYGKFIACSGFPECKYSRPLEPINKDEQKALEGEEAQVCEKCGGKMILKEGRFGRFLACENYPKCKTTKTVSGKTGLSCPKCEIGEIVARKTKRGRTFWGCSKYPECDYATWEDPAKKE